MNCSEDEQHNILQRRKPQVNNNNCEKEVNNWVTNNNCEKESDEVDTSDVTSTDSWEEIPDNRTGMAGFTRLSSLGQGQGYLPCREFVLPSLSALT